MCVCVCMLCQLVAWNVRYCVIMAWHMYDTASMLVIACLAIGLMGVLVSARSHVSKGRSSWCTQHVPFSVVAGASLLMTAVTEVGVVSILFTCMMWTLFVCLYFSLSCKLARVVTRRAVVVYTSLLHFSLLLFNAAGGGGQAGILVAMLPSVTGQAGLHML